MKPQQEHDIATAAVRCRMAEIERDKTEELVYSNDLWEARKALRLLLDEAMAAADLTTIEEE